MQGGKSHQENGQKHSGRVSAKTTSAAAAGRNSNSSSQTTPPLQAKLRQHVTRDDSTMQNMTESILYTFIPSAMKAIAATPEEEEVEAHDTARITLDARQATAVASAALAVATLLNCPSGLLEFLLCLPWSQFADVYATIGDAPHSSTAPRLHLATPTDDEKFNLVNCQLDDDSLLDCLMDFIYTQGRGTMIPPLMCLDDNEYVPQNGAKAGKLQRSVLAQLQGCTPLHCAAMRGNPALVNVLLTAGADPLAKNALGQVPMELVPKCGGGTTRLSRNSTKSTSFSPTQALSSPSSSASSVCRCMNQCREQEGWECQTNSVRFTLIRKSIMTYSIGILALLQMFVLCVLCLLGFKGCPTTLLCPEVESRSETCWEERKKKAQHTATSILLKFRAKVLKGREELCLIYDINSNDLPSTENDYLEKEQQSFCGESGLSTKDNTGSAGAGGGKKLAALRAYSHLSSSVAILKSIRLQQQRYFPSTSSRILSSSSLIPEAHFLPKDEWSNIKIDEIEIADLWDGLTDAALALLEECGCDGCRETAGSAIHTAVKELMQLSFSGDDKKNSSSSKTFIKKEQQEQHQSSFSSPSSSPLPELKLKSAELASYVAAAVQAKAQFLLKTDVQQSPTRAAIWRAQQCITEWSRVAQFAFTALDFNSSPVSSGFSDDVDNVNSTKTTGGRGDGGGGGEIKISNKVGSIIKNTDGDSEGGSDEDPLVIQCLEEWATSAAADVVLVEALLGRTLPLEQPLSEAVPLAVHYDAATGGPQLGRTVTKSELLQLQNALKQAEDHASDHIFALVQGVAQAVADELAAGERLDELLTQRSANVSNSSVDGVTEEQERQLAAAIDAASRFSSLKNQVAQVEAMRDRWAHRAAAQKQLDIAVESARDPAPPGILTNLSLNEELFWKELRMRIQLVEAAMEAARQSSISVARAKKTLTDLQAQGAAVEAGKVLDDALNGKKGGSAALKAALSKAENASNAATAAAAAGAGAFTIGSDWLAPRLLIAKNKLNLERAAEGLARVVPSCRTVADLPKLEAAILAARKVGAHELDATVYTAAKELRTRLDAASKAKLILENAIRSLQKQQNRKEDDIREAGSAILAAEQHGNLLQSDVAAAREAVAAIQAASAAELKLTKALQEGAGVGALSLAIKEAAAAGVPQVNEARKILKLMQNLESAVSAAASSSESGHAARQSLQAKIAAAAAGGVPNSIISEARNTLHKLLITDVRAELDVALKLTKVSTHGKAGGVGEIRQTPAQRLATLRAVLEKVDSILALEDNERDINREAYGSSAAPERTFSITSTSIDGGSGSAGGGNGGNDGATTPPLLEEPSTMLNGRLGRLPLSTQGSFTSQAASSSSSASTPRWSSLAGSGVSGGIGGGGGGSGSGGDLSHLGDCIAIELHVLCRNEIAVVWFEPRINQEIENEKDDAAGAAVVGGDAGDFSLLASSSHSNSSVSGSDIVTGDALLSSSLAEYDDAIAVRWMAQQARKRLFQEEQEQARLERQKSEEARLYREVQLREKSVREAVEKERAEKARAERAERLAAVEAQKAERRERDRVARAERELERQAREAAAREHFLLLQRRRKMLADQARAAEMAQLLAAQQTQQTAGLFSPPTSPAIEPRHLEEEHLMMLPLGSEAVSTSGVMQLLSFVDQEEQNVEKLGTGGTETDVKAVQVDIIPVSTMQANIDTTEASRQHEPDALPPSLLPRMPSSSSRFTAPPLPPPAPAAPPLTATSSLPGSSSHTTIWTSADSHENVLLSTKINATALPPSSLAPTAAPLFGDLGGASWLSTNPLTSNHPLTTSLTPPRHVNSTNSTISHRTSTAPSVLWGSADSILLTGGANGGTGGALASTIATDIQGHQHHLNHHHSIGSSTGYDLASGLWSSIGSEGAVSAGGGAGGGGFNSGANLGVDTSVLGIYPAAVQNTSTPSKNTYLNGTASALTHENDVSETSNRAAAHFRLPSETSLFLDL